MGSINKVVVQNDKNELCKTSMDKYDRISVLKCAYNLLIFDHSTIIDLNNTVTLLPVGTNLSGLFIYDLFCKSNSSTSKYIYWPP
jgi:hypothetical protein